VAVTSYDEMKAQVEANLDYDGDPDKARLLIEALRWRILFVPKMSADSGTVVTLEGAKELLKEAQAYLDAHGDERARFVRGRCV
jgi:hypothetical protein